MSMQDIEIQLRRENTTEAAEKYLDEAFFSVVYLIKAHISPVFTHCNELNKIVQNIEKLMNLPEAKNSENANIYQNNAANKIITFAKDAFESLTEIARYFNLGGNINDLENDNTNLHNIWIRVKDLLGDEATQLSINAVLEEQVGVSTKSLHEIISSKHTDLLKGMKAFIQALQSFPTRYASTLAQNQAFISKLESATLNIKNPREIKESPSIEFTAITGLPDNPEPPSLDNSNSKDSRCCPWFKR